MKLYVFPPSPNAFFPLCVLHHLGLNADLEIVDLTQGATHTDAYRAMNPNELMPTLVDDDYVLWESAAIARYLCSKSHDQTLWPEDAREQADVLRWMSWRIAHFGPACGALLFQNFVKLLQGDDSGPDPDKIREGSEQFRKFAGVLDQHLEGRDWMVGEGPTLADFTLAVWVFYKDRGRFPMHGFTNIEAWFDRVAALEGFQKATPQMPASS